MPRVQTPRPSDVPPYGQTDRVRLRDLLIDAREQTFAWMREQLGLPPPPAVGEDGAQSALTDAAESSDDEHTEEPSAIHESEIKQEDGAFETDDARGESGKYQAIFDKKVGICYGAHSPAARSGR